MSLLTIKVPIYGHFKYFCHCHNCHKEKKKKNKTKIPKKIAKGTDQAIQPAGGVSLEVFLATDF